VYNQDNTKSDDVNVNFSIFTKNSGILTKKISLKDGKLIKNADDCRMNTGTGRVVSCLFSEMPDYIQQMKANQALAIGVPLMERFSVVANAIKQKNPDSPAITRTLENFRFSNVIMFDVDGYDLSVIDQLSRAYPPIKTAAKVVSFSASSNISDSAGNRLTECNGIHIYMPVNNPEAIPVFADLLFKRSWLSGNGFIFISKSGGIYPRVKTFDKAVFSPERLVFEANPLLEDGLTQDRPACYYEAGEVLDIDGIEPLTEAEEKLYAKAVADAKEAAKPESLAIKEAYIESRIEEHVSNTACKPEHAETVIRRAAETSELTGEFLLYFDKLGTVTVSDVIFEPMRYNGETLRDPLEPDYGAAKAIFYANEDQDGGVPIINSFAHGGKTYRLFVSDSLDDTGIDTVIMMPSENDPEAVKAASSKPAKSANPVKKKQPEVLPKLELRCKPGCLDEQVAFCIQVMADRMPVYERSGKLYRVADVKDRSEKNGCNSMITQVTPNWLKLELMKHISFYKIKRLKDEGSIREYMNCPPDIPTIICDMSGDWGVPYLAGVLKAPTVTPEGRIISQHGYDKDTALYHSNGINIRIPANITSEQVSAAKACIDEVLKDFCFDQPVDKSVAFAAVLTSVTRQVLPSAPLFAFDSNTPGTGKGLISDCLSLIALGREPATVNISSNDDVFEKRLDMILYGGEPAAMIDNIQKPLNSERFCTILTQEYLPVRRMHSYDSLVAPTRVFWTVTGNNLRFSGDITRRTLKCRFKTSDENPEERHFDVNLRDFCRKNRSRIIRSVIILLKNYLNKGEVPVMNEYGSFEVWNSFIRGCVISLGMVDPLISKMSVKAEDVNGNQIACFISEMYDVFGNDKFTASEVLAASQSNHTLYDLLVEVSADGKTQPNSRSIGWYLKRVREVVLGGRRIVALPKQANVIVYQIQDVA
jgi:hypothetical protein